jgi:hypothetical protein
MRSKFLVCAAIAAASASTWFVSAARAADAKDPNGSSGKKKAAELHADEKSMKKQLQWEDKVMGPESKRAELDKIARARAINEKAEKEKERQAALEAASPAPKTAAQPRKADKTEVSLISAAQEKQERDEANRSHEISPQLETAAAQAPVKAVKPADDKFIDKLLRQEDAPSKKRASANDKELESLLAGAKEKERPTGRKRADSVDALLKTADKGPAMPAPRAQSGGLPEWAKQPDIAPSAPPPPPPVAVKVAPKNTNTGVIQVVQGAAGASAAVIPPRSAAVAARPGRKSVSKTPVTWNDPFADKKTVASYAAPAPKKEPASRPSATSGGTSGGTWNDPFADTGETRKPIRRTAPASTSSAPASTPRHNDKVDKSDAPARGGGSRGGSGSSEWKDPFTKAPAEPTRTPVAMRELGKGESSKWEIASRHAAPRTASDTHAASGWGVIKKRAR